MCSLTTFSSRFILLSKSSLWSRPTRIWRNLVSSLISKSRWSSVFVIDISEVVTSAWGSHFVSAVLSFLFDLWLDICLSWLLDFIIFSQRWSRLFGRWSRLRLINFFIWIISASWRCVYSLSNFKLWSFNNIINFISYLFYLSFSIKAFSDVIICFNKSFEFFLKTVVLIVQIGHMLIQGTDLSLEFNLVFVHLIWVLLQPVNLVSHRLLILLRLLIDYKKFLFL